MIRLTSRLTPGAYFRLLMAASVTPPVLGLLGLAALISAAYVFWSFAGTCGGVPVAAVFAAATAVIVVAFIAAIVTLFAGLQTVIGKNRNLYVPVEVAATEEGLTTSSELGEGTVRWGAFVRVRRVGEYVLLYQTSRTFFALGGAGVPGETLDELEALARKHASR